MSVQIIDHASPAHPSWRRDIARRADGENGRISTTNAEIDVTNGEADIF